MPFALKFCIRLINNEDIKQNYSCPTFIRLSVPSWHGGFVQKMGKEDKKEECALRRNSKFMYINAMLFNYCRKAVTLVGIYCNLSNESLIAAFC